MNKYQNGYTKNVLTHELVMMIIYYIARQMFILYVYEFEF